MKYIPNVLSRTVGRTILQTQKHSPALLFGTGIAGMVAASVLACRATLKLEEVLDEIELDKSKANRLINNKHPDYSEDDYKKDMLYLQVRSVVKVCKLYAPAIGVGLASVGMLAQSHNILTKRNAALVAAYSVLEKSFNDYRDRVREDLGEDRERQYRFPTEEIHDHSDGTKKKTKIVSPSSATIYARFFDQLCSSWSKNPEFNLLFLKCQQDYANDLLQARGHVFLNEVYDMMGIERSSAGSVVGWVISKNGGDNFIDFGIFNGDNPKARDFVNGREGAILLDFNVDGVIYDLIEER